MSSAVKGIIIVAVILSFFCLMSRLDFIVHGTLYEYGLEFSYDWAVEYWIVYIATFVVFSLVLGSMYWLGSGKTGKDLKFSIALSLSVIILVVVALQDVMVYILWVGNLPPGDFVWWWSPWSRLVGGWTTSMQIALTLAGLVATLFLWAPSLWSIFRTNSETSV